MKYPDENGFIYFTTTGGWFDQTLLNQRMVLHTEKGQVYGVIGSKPPHAMKEEETKKPVKAEDMFIDIGAAGQTDASVIHLSREGIPTGVISTPSRYIHTPVTVMCMWDLEKSARLIAKAVEGVHRYF